MSTLRRFRTALLAGAALGSLSSVQAYAEEAGAEAGAELEAVVVTAQRRAERLQDVPLSVTSVSGQTIEDSNFRSVTDLQYLAPGVQFDPTNGSAFQIRGVGSTSYDFSFAKSVNVVVDDVVMDAPRDNGMLGLTDIRQVDVLMGPQGTLFGRNSTSGVIAITTAKPVLGMFSAKGDVSYGEREDRSANLTVNAPISDRLALRVTGFSQGQEGYGRYAVLNQSLNLFREYGVRARLLFQPADGVELIYAGEYSHHYDNLNRTTVGGGSAAFTAIQIANGVTPGPRNDDNADSKIGDTETSTWGHSLRAEIQIGRDTLTSITAYRETEYDGNGPANFAPAEQFAFTPYNRGAVDTKKFSQELRWASPTGGFLEYLGGVFYNRLELDASQIQWVTFGAPLVSPTGVRLTSFTTTTGAIGDNSNATRFKTEAVTAAAFGQLKFNLTPRFNLSLGARYTHDSNSQSQTFFRLDPVPITGVAATFTATARPPLQPSGRVKGDNFSYRISGQYKLTDDTMLYATYATGYKPGAVAFVGNNYSPYGEETVKSVEAGVKAELFERRVRLNLNVFHSKFTDFQTSLLTFVPGNPVAVIATGNAGGLKSEGVEATFAWRALDGLTLAGGVTYADAVFTDFQYNATTNYAGTALSYAPKWQAALSAKYDGEIGEDLRLRASLDYAYRSKVFPTIGEPANVAVPGYGIVNGRLSLSPVGSDFEFGVYGRNLLDKYFSTAFQQYSSLTLTHYTTRDAHRTLGVFAKYSF